MSGSEGGPGKRTDGDVGTAPRADPYHLKVRLEQEKLCLLVMIGVRADGTQGAGSAHRRLPRGRRVVGRSAA